MRIIFDSYKTYQDLIHQKKIYADNQNHIQFELLCGDMSYKQFFRVHFQSQTYILVVIPTAGSASIETFVGEHELNITPAASFIQTATTLFAHINHVAKVHAVDEAHGLVLLDDHGKKLLEDEVALQSKDPAKIIALFVPLFKWLKQFQALTHQLPADFFGLHRTLEEQALLIELQEYVQYSKNPEPNIEKHFSSLAKKIAEQPLTLIHRDFQSKNILLEGKHFWVIDYQDLCLGSYTYDYASLIYDPYLDLPTELQEQLIQLCWEILDLETISFQQFRADLQQCAIQRLLKAAGRYARHFALTGKDTHMKYYQPAVEKVKILLSSTC